MPGGVHVPIRRLRDARCEITAEEVERALLVRTVQVTFFPLYSLEGAMPILVQGSGGPEALEPPRYHRAVRRLFQRIHNPRNSVCGCDPDCWCRTKRIGRLVKWWFPARYFGIRHKNSWFDRTFKGWTDDEIRAWKREQELRTKPMRKRQPDYLSIVRIGPRRFGLRVRLQDGSTVIHELRRD